MHGRHGRGPRHGWRRQGRQARVTHLLEPAVLVCLSQGRMHPYGLAEKLAEYNLEQAALRRIYRVLQNMEEMGWVVSTRDSQDTQGPPRRIYALTPEGEEVLAEWVVLLQESRDAIDRLLATFARQQRK